MSVKVKRIDERNILVNEKLVRMDMEGNWIETEELSSAESKALYTHLNNEALDMKNRLN